MVETRSKRWTNLFLAVIGGRDSEALSDPKLFLEAIYKLTPASTCLSLLASSSHGLDTLVRALSCDTSLAFLKNQVTTFLEYLRSTELQNGVVIQQILVKLFKEAPLTWKSLVQAAQNRVLDERALSAFAWALFQLLSMPEEATKYLSVAQNPAIQQALKFSSSHVRLLQRQIATLADSLTKSAARNNMQRSLVDTDDDDLSDDDTNGDDTNGDDTNDDDTNDDDTNDDDTNDDDAIGYDIPEIQRSTVCPDDDNTSEDDINDDDANDNDTNDDDANDNDTNDDDANDGYTNGDDIPEIQRTTVYPREENLQFIKSSSLFRAGDMQRRVANQNERFKIFSQQNQNPDMAEARKRRLKTLFSDVLEGKKTAASNNPKLFLEAICEQTPAVTSISNLVASPHGLKTLSISLGCDTSLSFLNGQLTTFLEFIKVPDLKTVCDGNIIRQILTRLMAAPLTWKSLVKAAKDQALNEAALSAFAWVLNQLLLLPEEEAIAYLPLAQDPDIYRAVMSSTHDIRVQGYQIFSLANALAKKTNNYTPQGPGGRHDNDISDIQKISIYPTQDELNIMKILDPYLPTVNDVQQQIEDSGSLASHIVSQFRLLRENMLCDLREEFAALAHPEKWRRKPLEIRNLVMMKVCCDERFPWALELICRDDLPRNQAYNQNTKKRKKFWQENPQCLKHGFLVCLFVDDKLVTLGTLFRKEDKDGEIVSPKTICVQIPMINIENVLRQLKFASSGIRLLLLDTAIFTYEPVLKQLKKTQELLLAPEIVGWQAGNPIPPPEYDLDSSIKKLLQDLRENYSTNLQPCLKLNRRTMLDKAQADCFRAALEQRVVVIQGPPGTGKSFIGSLVGKAIYESSDEKILVVCYTHHALDDFLEHLLDLGIPDDDIVRLGSSHKATDRTKNLALKEYKKDINLTIDQSHTLDTGKMIAKVAARNLKEAFFLFHRRRHNRDLLEFLKSYEDELPFYSAFQVSEDEDGMTWVGKNGKKIDECYLIDRWLRGKDAGTFRFQMAQEYRAVWQLSYQMRKQKHQQWNHEMTKGQLAEFQKAGNLYNQTVERIDSVWAEREFKVMRKKRIIACTTTAAAKYSEAIRRVSPGVLLVEEAGEILESHVLTALGPKTKHLILIGDHKQLRPKVNYELSVEKGTGYDLNRSLFERLIMKKFPYQTLFSQHRMRREISAFVRKMTYPELQDAKETEERPYLLGFTNNIIFVNHSEPENELSGARELRDSSAMTSKQNLFEAKMTLKCVRYLRQQGYRPDDIVVLTPYLGQLRLLHDILKVDNDPVLNDKDYHDLVHAGLTPEAADKANKPNLRISTIDNFQGEEANVVVASLTRSNINNDIGFMYAPERLNVLISRARNALILIGNAEHFIGSRKGGDLWKEFIGLLKAGMHVYDGFPVRCERHIDRKTVLQKPEDFDTECPDGGCKEVCNIVLKCGIHKCPYRCHEFPDHSKIDCKAAVSYECKKGHVYSRQCHIDIKFENQNGCKICAIEAKKAQEEADRKKKDLERKKQHLLKMAEIDNQIEAIKNGTVSVEVFEQEEIVQKKDSQTMKVVRASNENFNAVLPSENPDRLLKTVKSASEIGLLSLDLPFAAFKQPLRPKNNFRSRSAVGRRPPTQRGGLTAARPATHRGGLTAARPMPHETKIAEMDREIREIKAKAARIEELKREAIARQKEEKDSQTAECFLGYELASSRTTDRYNKPLRRAPHSMSVTQMNREIQAGMEHAELIEAVKKQAIALEQKKRASQTVKDAASRPSAFNRPPAGFRGRGVSVRRMYHPRSVDEPIHMMPNRGGWR